MDPEHAADLLARERARVEFALEDTATADVGESGVGDRPEGLTQFETDSALVSRLRNELAAIQAAEFRLREGTYGISVVSGDVISDEHLELIPWADRNSDEDDS
ncbi:MAG: hypothetical protein WCI34_00695 [Actinomycetes bacterium]